MRSLSKALTALILSVSITAALAQEYPSRQIHMVVGFAPGGANDTIARFVAAELQSRLKQTVVVENRTGAGGTIGAALVAKSAPDGYTLYLGSTGTNAIGPTLYPKLPYDPVNGLAPISIVAKSGNLVVVPADSPFKTVRELVAYAKANPNKLNYGSSGNGSTLHLAGEMFKEAAGVELTHVPYKGDAIALTDLAAGQIQITFSGIPPALSMARNGKARILAVTSAERMPTLPDVPTVAESGVPGMNVSTWYGLFAAAGTPPAILERLSLEVKNIIEQPAFKEKLAGQGVVAVSSTPAEFRSFVKQEIDRWGKAVKAAKVTID